MVVPTTSLRVLKHGSITLNQILKVSQLNGQQQQQNLILFRHFSKKQLTPSINFLTNNETDPFMTTKKQVSPRDTISAGAPTPPTKKSLTTPTPSLAEFKNPEQRPLSILLCWLMSKPNAIQKYAQFYLDQGFDVLTIRITPWELLWPSKFNQDTINNELLPILNSSQHNKKLIHGFSVGGYVFSQLLKQFYLNPIGNGNLIKSIQGQIWDSVVDVNGVSVGVSKSIAPNSIIKQKLFQSYIDWHMKIFQSIATKYYEEAHEYFYYKPLMAPSLFLASKIDPISTIDVINDVKNCWSSVGINCTSRTWDNTTHVGHMHKYPDEYKSIVKNFLQKIDWSNNNSSQDKKKNETTQRVIPNTIQKEQVIMPLPAAAVAPRRRQPAPTFA